MSTLKVNAIRGTGASSDAISVNSTDGTCTAKITNNLSNRNLIINGAMQCSSYGSSSTDNGYKTVDRFQMSTGGKDNNNTQAQHALTSSDTGPWEKGFRYSYHITNGDQTGGADAGDYAQIIYKLEAQDLANSGWDYTSTSSYITLSFWVKSSVAQTYYVRLNAEDASKAYSFAISVTTSWQKITKSIPGDSNLVVNDDNGCGLALYFIPFYGTNYTTSGHTNDSWITDSGSDQVTDMTSTWWTTNDATFEITGVQLEVGSYATDFEHRSYTEEHQRCRRYFFMLNGGVNSAAMTGIAYTDALAHIVVNYPVEMRAAASLYVVTGTSYWNYIRHSSVVDGTDTIAQNVSSSKNHMELMASGDVSAGGYTGMIRPNNTAARIGFSAEL